MKPASSRLLLLSPLRLLLSPPFDGRASVGIAIYFNTASEASCAPNSLLSLNAASNLRCCARRHRILVEEFNPLLPCDADTFPFVEKKRRGSHS